MPVLVAGLALVGAGSSSGAQIAGEAITCPSPALGGSLPAMVYLPPGYGSTFGRLPVVYFLHGLPAGPDAYQGYSYVAGALAAAGEPAIAVVPQGARAADSDREYLDWSPAEDWPDAIARDLTRCIDARYRTIAARQGRALIGVSAGGYGALNIGLRHLQTFAAVESWSGYFVATDPSGHHVLNLGSRRASLAAQVPSGTALKRALARWPSLIAFYVGRSDTRFFGVNRKFDRTLSAERIAHVYRSYPGGHSGSLWQPQAPRWLSMALGFLSRARSR